MVGAAVDGSLEGVAVGLDDGCTVVGEEVVGVEDGSLEGLALG